MSERRATLSWITTALEIRGARWWLQGERLMWVEVAGRSRLLVIGGAWDALDFDEIEERIGRIVDQLSEAEE